MNEETTQELREKLAEGQALVRMQDDQMQRLSLERKRDPERVLVQALAEVELAPEVAVKNYFSIQYGGAKATLVEGLSVRAAETLARLWGNCAVSSSLLEETEDRAVCIGTFLDYEAAYIRREVVRVSRIQHRREGADVRLAVNHWQTAIAKACSIAARNATLHALPVALKERYWAGVRAIIAKTETPQEPKATERYWQAVIYFFSGHGITRAQVEALVGHPCDAEHAPSESLVVELRGMRNAIEQGELIAADVFAHLERPAPTRVETQNGLGGTATVTRGAVAEPDTKPRASEPNGEPASAGAPAPAVDTSPLAPESPPEPEPPPPDPSVRVWNERGACIVCGRHQRFVEHQGHGKDGAGKPCPHGGAR